MENKNETSQNQKNSPVGTGSSDPDARMTAGVDRVPHAPPGTVRSGNSILPRFLHGVLGEVRENYQEALSAFHDIRERIRLELLTRGIWGDQSTGRQRTPAERPIENLESSLPRTRTAPALPKGQAGLDPAKSTGIRPMQGKESGTRFRNVLIVGGLDFLGAALVHQLNTTGFREITVTDALDDAICQRLPALQFQEFLSPAEFEKMAESRFRAMPVYSHVFYLGSWEADTMGLAKSLFVSAVKQGARFVALSSASSMGPRQPCAAEERNDPDNFRPLTRSGLVSCLFDRHALSKSAKKNYLSLKYHRLFGPGERLDGGLGDLVKSCHDQIRSTGSVRLPGALRPDAPEGRRLFDFYPVLDAARLALYLSQNPQAGGVYELGSGVSATPSALVRAVFNAVGRKEQIVWNDALDYDPPPLQPERAHLGRLEETGWKVLPPDLTTAVREYVKTYLGLGIELGEEPPAPAREKDKNLAAAPAPLPIKRRQRASFGD